MEEGSDHLLDTPIVMHYFRANAVYRAVEAEYGIVASRFRPQLPATAAGEVLAFGYDPQWDKARRERLQGFVAGCTILGNGEPSVFEKYAELHDFNKRNGANVGQNDLWIAAVASVTGLTLLTTDQDFGRLPPGTLDWRLIDAKTGATLR